MTNDQLLLSEKIALLALATFVTEAANPDIKERYNFTIEKNIREQLEKQGFITVHQSARPGRPYVHELTDLGWRRCREELAADAPKGAEKAHRIMYGINKVFSEYMKRANATIADVFVLPGQPSATVEERIRLSYRALTGEAGAFVSLTRLRSALGEVPRVEVDRALHQLALHPDVRLMPEANQKTLSDADRTAALHIGGEDKHLLSIKIS